MFGHEGEAAGFAIEPIDQRDLPAIGQFEGEQPAQAVPECEAAVRFARVRLDERRLLDDDPVGGFVDDVDGTRNRKLDPVLDRPRIGRRRMTMTN